MQNQPWGDAITKRLLAYWQARLPERLAKEQTRFDRERLACRAYEQLKNKTKVGEMFNVSGDAINQWLWRHERRRLYFEAKKLPFMSPFEMYATAMFPMPLNDINKLRRMDGKKTLGFDDPDKRQRSNWEDAPAKVLKGKSPPKVLTLDDVIKKVRKLEVKLSDLTNDATTAIHRWNRWVEKLQELERVLNRMQTIEQRLKRLELEVLKEVKG